MPLAITLSTQFLVAFIGMLALFTKTFSKQKKFYFLAYSHLLVSSLFSGPFSRVSYSSLINEGVDTALRAYSQVESLVGLHFIKSHITVICHLT